MQSPSRSGSPQRRAYFLVSIRREKRPRSTRSRRSGLSNRMRFWLAIIAAAAAAACSGGEAVSAPPGAGRGGAGAAVPVTIAPVVQKPMPIEINVIGTVEAYSNVAVRAQTTGELTSVNF